MAMNTGKFPLIRFETVNRPMAEARRIFDQRIEDATSIYEKHQSDFTVRPCPVCGGSAHDEVDRFHGTYGVAKCASCASLYVNPAPNLEALIDYYNNCECNVMLQDLYKSRSKGTARLILDDRVEAILAQIRSRIEHAQGKISILEVGCGSGRFLANLKGVLEQQGLLDKVRLVGVDIDRNAIASNTDALLELHAMPVELFSESSGQKFDVLLHFELVEHLTDPAAFMGKCHGLLKDGAVMIFTTPNAAGFELVASDYNGFRLIAHGIFPPMHLNAFSTQNIAVFLLRCGFTVKGITTPGNLDADMVTLMKQDLTDPGFQAFADLDDETKGVFQYLLKKLGCSSHMMVVAGRNDAWVG